MRSVLTLAYDFPPLGGAGVQRNLKFARYLPLHGYRSVVLTGPGAAAGRWAPRDEELAAEVGEAAVHRVPGPAPAEPTGWSRRAGVWLRRPTPFATWWRDGAVSVGLRAGAVVDVIHASMTPWESGEAAARLARLLGVPWVADLRDPWALDEMTVYPTALHRRLELERMRRVLGAADGVVMNTPEAARRALEHVPGLRGRPVVAIPNGYDGEDFRGPLAPREDGRFRIVHTGYLHTELGLQQRSRSRLRDVLGGAAPGLDILTRSHVVLLDGLDRLVARRPGLRERIEVVLAGVLSPADERAAANRAVRVTMPGYLSHSQSVGLLRSADLLFLPMHDLAPGARATIVPGKTYEYLASGTPILAAAPPGDAHDLLARSGRAEVCAPTDAAGLAAAVERALERPSAPVRTPDADDPIAAYERRRLTGELAAFLDRVVGGSRVRSPRDLTSTIT